MPAHSKGLTSAFALRLHPAERALADDLVAEHAEFDIKISVNDALRILIRRGAALQPATLPAIRAAREHHWATCDRCDATKVGCPEGAWLKRTYDRAETPRAPRAAPVERPSSPPIRPFSMEAVRSIYRSSTQS